MAIAAGLAAAGMFAFSLASTTSTSEDAGRPSARASVAPAPVASTEPDELTNMVDAGEAQPALASQQAAAFSRCGTVRTTCVVDGDTFWLQGAKIRIMDVDTPEVSQPQCPAEKALGERATDRLVELLNDGPFKLQSVGDRDTDRYGRLLRVVVRNGQSLGDQLVQEGLARTWTGRREPWC